MTDLLATALDAVNSLDADRQSTIAALNDRLTQVQNELTQAQSDGAAQVTSLNGQIATLNATIAQLQQTIVALQAQIPKPSKSVLGASLYGSAVSSAQNLQATLGVKDLRVYDSNQGPAWLLNVVQPLLKAGFNVAASFHLGGLSNVQAFTNGTAPQATYDAVNSLLKLPIDLIPEHEPDQKNRVPGPDWIAFAKKVRSMRDALGSSAKAKLWLCLTGSSPSRAATWFPGKGVLDGIGWDPYSNVADAQAVCKPFADAVKKLDPNLQVGVFEYGPFSNATEAQTKSIIQSIDAAKLYQAGVSRFYWYDLSVGAGKQISNDTTLAPIYKEIVTS